MPSFTNNTITVIGEQELAALIGGSNKMVITRVGVGSGVSGSPPLQTDLVTFQMNLTPRPPQVSANNVQQGEILVFATLDTANVGASFTWTEMGVYAQIGGQAEFLLAYCQNSANDSISYQVGLTRSVYNLQIPIDIQNTQNTQITVVAGSPYYDAPVRSPQGTISVTTPFDSAGRVIEYDIDVANAAGLLPPGVVLDFAGGTVPGGFLLCNAIQVLRSQFTKLFAVVGTMYGAGDGSTTFNLPDCRGRTTIGAGQGPGLGAYVLGQTLGEEYHTLTPSQMPSHTHTYVEPNGGAGHAHSYTEPNNGQGHKHAESAHGSDVDGAGFLNGFSGYAVPIGEGQNPDQGGPYPGGEDCSEFTYRATTDITINAATVGIAIQATGGNGAHNNIQPSIIFNKIIKY